MRWLTMGLGMAILGLASASGDETCSLKLRRLEQQNARGEDFIYRATMPQSFFSNVVALKMSKGGTSTRGNQSCDETFRRIVKKEPKYESKRPFRGVAKFGSQEFAFAMDAVEPALESGGKTADSKTANGKAIQLKKEQPVEPVDPEKAAMLRSLQYNRLYFDFNRNGDLCDDQVLEAVDVPQNRVSHWKDQSYIRFQFPRLDVTFESGGEKIASPFFVQGQAMVSPQFNYVSTSFNAAAYREGDIVVGGKKRRVVLIDFNSNGRLDDRTEIRTDIYPSDGRIFPQYGDVLLIDPKADRAAGSPYDATACQGRHLVSKIIPIDGSYYHLAISPAGDRLTLTPMNAPLGKVVHPNNTFSAIIYGKQGFIKIQGGKNEPIAVPEGQWTLLSYTLRWTPSVKNDGQNHGDDAKPVKDDVGPFGEFLAETVRAVFGVETTDHSKSASVSAGATEKCKVVKVVQGGTTVLDFGPPFKPVVRSSSGQDNDQLKCLVLELTLVGSAGEVVTDMTINGQRPPKPRWTITDASQKVVEAGTFEYG